MHKHRIHGIMDCFFCLFYIPLALLSQKVCLTPASFVWPVLAAQLTLRVHPPGKLAATVKKWHHFEATSNITWKHAASGWFLTRLLGIFLCLPSISNYWIVTYNPAIIDGKWYTFMYTVLLDYLVETFSEERHSSSRCFPVLSPPSTPGAIEVSSDTPWLFVMGKTTWDPDLNIFFVEESKLKTWGLHLKNFHVSVRIQLGCLAKFDACRSLVTVFHSPTQRGSEKRTELEQFQRVWTGNGTLTYPKCLLGLVLSVTSTKKMTSFSNDGLSQENKTLQPWSTWEVCSQSLPVPKMVGSPINLRDPTCCGTISLFNTSNVQPAKLKSVQVRPIPSNSRITPTKHLL